jgi:hypothetical protein
MRRRIDAATWTITVAARCGVPWWPVAARRGGAGVLNRATALC